MDSALQNSLEDLMKRLAELEQQMKLKVDKNDFDNHIMSIREMIGNLDQEEKATEIKIKGGNGAEKQEQFNAKEVQQIKNMIEKFPSHDESI